MLDLDLYNFHLPEQLIRKYPTENRDESKLLCYAKTSREVSYHSFSNLVSLLQPGDILVRNNTLVEKRRVFVNKSSGGRLECLLLEPSDSSRKEWKCLVKGLKKWRVGEDVYAELNPDISFKLMSKDGQIATIASNQPLDYSAFGRIGNVPIPPYFNRAAEPIDEVRYQTIYANQPGSAAAPTAGLHFTDSITEKLRDRGVIFVDLTLHVGYGTFAPLSEDNFKSGSLHEEHYEISEAAAAALNGKKESQRIISIGTTTLRALESNFRKNSGKFKAEKNSTKIFLYPPDKVRSVEGLLTNFHLPGSSLLMLVSCIVPREQLLHLYELAIQNKFQFYSYGDAMLITN